MIILEANPFSFECDVKACALVIIDMQRDFIEPGGFGESLGNDVSPLQQIVPQVERLLEAFRIKELCVVHTRECHKPDLSDCPDSKLNRGSPTMRIGDPGPMGRILIDGEPGADIIESLTPYANEFVIAKPGKGAFYNTELDSILKSNAITHLVVAGVTTEVCVQSTLREANDRGYTCLLATDATASYFPEFKQSTIDMVRAQGAIVGWTATVSQIIESLSS
ncbi:MAG: cysteine hydrolase family protein [Granulosicoccus sp.]